MKLKSTLKIVAILTLVFLNVGCDQLSKKMAREHIIPNESIAIINDNFVLMNVENSGAAYSIGSDLSPVIKRVLLQIIPATVLLVLLWLSLVKSKYTNEMIVGFCFIIGGGIGNVFDRIAYGSVTDFMYIDLGFFNTQIFNMADVSIVVGSLIIVSYTFLSKKEKLIETA